MQRSLLILALVPSLDLKAIKIPLTHEVINERSRRHVKLRDPAESLGAGYVSRHNAARYQPIGSTVQVAGLFQDHQVLCSVCVVHMLLWFVLWILNFYFFRPSTAVREEQTSLALLADLTDPEDAQSNESNEELDQKVIHVQPSEIEADIQMQYKTGVITKVEPGTQAQDDGLQVGQRIIKVENTRYSQASFTSAERQGKPFDITVNSPSSFEKVVILALVCLKFPAALLGCLLVLGLPWSFYAHITSDFQKSAKAFSHRLILSACVVQQFADVILTMRSWSYMGILNKVDVITDIGFAFGLAIGVVFNLNNRALDVPLKSEGVALLRQMDLVAWSLCSILVVSRIADFVCKYSPSSIAGLDVMMDPAHVRGILYRLGWIPADFVFLQFILLMTRTSVATHQQMLEVKDAMPCEAAEFSERVHRPCAKWLEECTLQLSTWGLPLALLIPEIIERGFMLYGILNFHSGEEEYMRLATLLESFRQTCNVLFSVFGVVLGPIQVSSTRRELRNALSEERRRDATLHTQIQAVETMVDSQNDGKGFGIPVFRLFVLNGAFLQTMCIRVALVGTAVKAFLDSEMGFAKVSQETSQEMLHNFTKNVTQFQETSQEMLRNCTKNVTKVHKDS